MSPDDIPPEAPAPAAPAALADALDPNEDDPAALWAEIARLRAAVEGPRGYASWQDAATDERTKRVRLADALRQCLQAMREMLANHAIGIYSQGYEGLVAACEAASAALAAQPQEPAREPTDEEIAGLWPRFRRYGPTGMMERGRAPLPPGALEFARAVRAWKPEERDRG